MRLCVATLTLAGLLGTVVVGGAGGGQGEKGKIPNFVFTGTVQKLEAANVPHVKASNRTVIVTVDDVHSQLPAALAGVKGRPVTVELSQSLADAPLQVGQKVVFSTQDHVYGENIAVREVAERGEAQKGTWLLHNQQIANPEMRTHLITAAASVANSEMQNTYTALEPADFIPAHDRTKTELDQIREMIRSNQ
jgi:hypothetical protein